jgi:hypothetical protein
VGDSHERRASTGTFSGGCQSTHLANTARIGRPWQKHSVLAGSFKVMMDAVRCTLARMPYGGERGDPPACSLWMNFWSARSVAPVRKPRLERLRTQCFAFFAGNVYRMARLLLTDPRADPYHDQRLDDPPSSEPVWPPKRKGERPRATHNMQPLGVHRVHRVACQILSCIKQEYMVAVSQWRISWRYGLI